MFKLLRILLFPIAVIYDIITRIRNWMYDANILKSKSYAVSTIAVGNLSVGGTGKTPMIEYLIGLLSHNYKTAVLSRGYKRKSEGFVLANNHTKVEDLGDEPFQFFTKFKNLKIAVDANRQNGIEQLIALENPDVILLDDCLQHRKVKARFYILLTKFNDLYVNDYLLPTGNLRESKNGTKRANVIVVTKCPMQLSEKEQHNIVQKINPKTYQKVFFSTIIYDEYIYNGTQKISVSEVKNTKNVVVAGIASPQLFFDYISNKEDTILEYPDHYDFKTKDILNIEKKAKNKLIITTEKDYMRLKEKIKNNNLYYLPIRIKILNNEEKFNELILENVRKNYLK